MALECKRVDDFEEIMKIQMGKHLLKEYGQYSEHLQIQHDPS